MGKGKRSDENDKFMCYLFLLQLFVMCGPIFLMIYYLGETQHLIQGTCSLEQNIVGPFNGEGEVKDGCYATKVTLTGADGTPHRTGETLVLSVDEYFSGQIDDNATKALDFPCYYNPPDPAIDDCAKQYPDNQNKQNICTTARVAATGLGWKPANNDKQQKGCTTYDLYSFCRGGGEEEEEEENQEHWCFSVYFHNQTKYISLDPEDKWSQGEFFRTAGWICTGILLCEMMAGCASVGESAKSSKKMKEDQHQQVDSVLQEKLENLEAREKKLKDQSQNNSEVQAVETINVLMNSDPTSNNTSQNPKKVEASMDQQCKPTPVEVEEV